MDWFALHVTIFLTKKSYNQSIISCLLRWILELE